MDQEAQADCSILFFFTFLHFIYILFKFLSYFRNIYLLFFLYQINIKELFMKVKSSPLELRGIASKQKKDGSFYYMVNVEEADGSALSFYCPKREVLPDGLHKGDMVCFVFDYVKFNREERLVVSALEKVAQ